MTETSAKPSVSKLSRPRATTARYRAELLCALLLALMGLNFFSVLPRKNLTIDETIHIPAGFYNLHRNFRINPEHPPLVKMLAALPLLFTDTEAPALEPEREYWDYQVAQEFWRLNAARYELITFWPRVPMIAIALMLGAVIFIYSRRLFGPRAALLSVALYSLEPTVLAHGRVVKTDLPSALPYLLLSLMLYFYLQMPTWRRAICLGLSAGLALAVNFSMVPLAPLAILPLLGLLIFAPRFGQRRAPVAAQLSLAVVMLLLVINAAYLFHHRRPESYRDLLSAVTGRAQTGALVSDGALAQSYQALQRIVPADFMKGISTVFLLDRGRSPASLLGRYSYHGWWYYFPVAFALKTTIPFLVLSLASVIWAVWALVHRRNERVLALLVPLFSFIALAMMSPINIGIRHFLPAYPFLFMLGGAFLDRLLSYSRPRAITVAGLVLLFGWMSFEAVRAYPDYMTYMNELGSRAPNWYYLSDSNVEWGDDVKGLAKYLREQGEDTVCATIWGFELLEGYGIKLVCVGPSDPRQAKTRYVAVGASFLNGSVNPSRNVDEYAAYRELRAEKVIGGSIYLYRIGE